MPSTDLTGLAAQLAEALTETLDVEQIGYCTPVALESRAAQPEAVPATRGAEAS